MDLMEVVDGTVERLRLALNGVYYRAAGGENRPVFFDIASTCPELLALDRAFPVIREELLRVLPKQAELPRYHELDPDQTFISKGEGDNDPAWRVFMLYAMRSKPEANRALCPRTAALIDRVPNLFQAFFSILDPGKSIPPHEGPYKGYVRYHLGLIVPKERPPSIRIKDQVRTWEEGKSFMFDDSWEHQVYNEASSVRVVLIVDTLRPMPFLQHRLNHAVSNHVISRLYGKRIVQKLTKDLR